MVRWEVHAVRSAWARGAIDEQLPPPVDLPSLNMWRELGLTDR